MANAQFGLKDLLTSFDNEIGMLVTLDDSKKVQLPPPLGEAPIPGFAIMAKVKDDKLSEFYSAHFKKPLVLRWKNTP